MIVEGTFPKTEQSLHYVLLIVLLIMTGCCKTPLQKAIHNLAPDYEAKRPAASTPDLGHRKIKDGLDTNQCYSGRPDTDVPSSFNYVNLTYDGEANGDLAVDFGSTIKVSVGASSKVNSDVRLENLTLTKLSGLYMNPRSQCADSESREAYKIGAIDEVVVRAIKSETVTVTSNDSGSAKVQVNTPVTFGAPIPIGQANATMGGNYKQTEAWGGNHLYIAHQVQKFHTVLKSKEFVGLSIPGTTDRLGACTFTVHGFSDSEWEGSLDCDGTQVNLPKFHAPFNSSDGRQTAPGVSYSVRVGHGTSVGTANVEIIKWTVSEIQ